MIIWNKILVDNSLCSGKSCDVDDSVPESYRTKKEKKNVKALSSW